MRESRGREVGELLRAFSLLAPDDEAVRRRIASLLGFGWRDGSAEAGSLTPDDSSQPTTGGAAAEPHTERETREAGLPRRAKSQAPDPFELVPLEARSRGEEPRWLREAPPLPRPEDQARPEPPPVEPLLDRRRTRALLCEILGSQRLDGIDFAALERRIGEARPLVELERLSRRTLARGVEVLVDRSPNLAPFFADQDLLVAQVRALVGEGVRVLRFAGSPLAGAGPGSPRLWRSWRPPDPARLILILSDLGIGRGVRARRTEPQEWLKMAAMAREAGCTLVALVPYPEKRWPRRLAGALPILTWDHRLALRHVRLATGRTRMETG